MKGLSKMRKLIILSVCLFLSSFVVSCSEFDYGLVNKSCVFIPDSVWEGKTADLLVCDFVSKGTVCRDLASDPCGYVWRYPKTYRDLDLIGCSVVHEGVELPCDLSTVKKYDNPRNPDEMILEIKTPSCELGDVYEIHRRYYYVDYSFRGFEYLFSLDDEDFIKKSVFELLVPKNTSVKYVSTTGQEPEVFDEGNVTRYVWVKHNASAIVIEDSMLDFREVYDIVYVSSWETQDLIDFMAEIYEPKSTKRLVEKSSEIRGYSTGLEAVKKIYDWVRINVNYSDVDDLRHTIYPLSTDKILDDLRGDCKDKGYILANLLNAQGFDVEPVIYGSPYNSSMYSFYDHIAVLVHIDAESYLLDPTCLECPFGTYPSQMYGQYYVPLYGDRVLKFPEKEDPDYLTEVDMTYRIDKTGDFDIYYTYSYPDLVDAETERISLLGQTESERNNYLMRIASNACIVKQIHEMKIENLYDTGMPLSLILNFSCYPLQIKENQISFIPPNIHPHIDQALTSNRINDFNLEGNFLFKSNVKTIFPTNYKITTDITDYNISGKDYEFIQTAKIEKNQVLIEKTYKLPEKIRIETYPKFRNDYLKTTQPHPQVISIKNRNQTTLIIPLILAIIAIITITTHKKNKKD